MKAWLIRQAAHVDLEHHSRITIEGAQPGGGPATASARARIQLEFEVTPADLELRAHANQLLREAEWPAVDDGTKGRTTLNAERHSAANPSMPRRKSTGFTATNPRICGVT